MTKRPFLGYNMLMNASGSPDLAAGNHDSPSGPDTSSEANREQAR